MQHTSFLLTVPDLVKSLSTLYLAVDSRLSAFRKLEKLHGRLEVLLSQVQKIRQQKLQQQLHESPNERTLYYDEGKEDSRMVQIQNEVDEEISSKEDISFRKRESRKTRKERLPDSSLDDEATNSDQIEPIEGTSGVNENEVDLDNIQNSDESSNHEEEDEHNVPNEENKSDDDDNDDDINLDEEEDDDKDEDFLLEEDPLDEEDETDFYSSGSKWSKSKSSSAKMKNEKSSK